MKGHTQVIELLNEALTAELTAINQYFLHSKMVASWGYEKLAAKMHAESISEMKHASALTDRVLFLGGIPNLQRMGKLCIGETVREMLASDLEMEEQAIERLKRGIALCFETADHASRELLESILESEEQHQDWLEAQLRIISEIGVENYLAGQIHA